MHAAKNPVNEATGTAQGNLSAVGKIVYLDFFASAIEQLSPHYADTFMSNMKPIAGLINIKIVKRFRIETCDLGEGEHIMRIRLDHQRARPIAHWLTFSIATALSAVCTHTAHADDLQARMKFWENKAYLCPAQPGISAFPSKKTEDAKQPCDDGDMTLFNGLLCAAGDKRGCTGVVDAQHPDTGEWARSPRIRLLGTNDRGDAYFSPDMALGLQLYFVKTGDVQRAYKWLTWMHKHVPCVVEIGGQCQVPGIPRFCTNDKDAGCTMRPGDAAQLSATVSYLQEKHGMPALPDGRLRGYLGTFSGYGPAIAEIDANVNKSGFSQHLVAVEIQLMRAMGHTDARIGAAAKKLAEKEPRNAYFMFLNQGATPAVTSMVLEKCPSPIKLPISPLNEWQWERDEASHAWEHSIYWDCIFMARMIRPNGPWSKN